jgi:hypothetical protein
MRSGAVPDKEASCRPRDGSLGAFDQGGTVQHHKDPRPRDPRRPLRHRVDPYAATCPLDSEWRDWDFLNVPNRRLTGAAIERHHVLRKLNGVRDLGELELAWEIAFDDPGRLIHEAGGDSTGNHPWSSHIHAETTIDDSRLHIDWITASRFGPGRSMTEVRIFLDGALVGQGFSGGCSLGFGGSDLPAVAMVGRDKAVVVDGSAQPLVAYEDALSRYFRCDAAVQRPCVWLWEVASQGLLRTRRDGPRKRLGRRDPRMHREWEIPPRKEFDGYSMDDWLDGIEPPPPQPLKLPQ